MRTRLLLAFAVLVTLAACGGPAMPELVGADLEEATEQLEDAGLDYQVAERGEEDESLHGTVVRQWPDAGERLEEDQRAVITVGVEPTFDVQGTFVLRGESRELEGGGCRGTGGYDDFGEGMRVTVRDGEGQVIGTGTTHSSWRLNRNHCEVEWEVEGLPRRDFYSIEVGRRGELTYSFDEMQEMEWTVTLTLG